MIFSFPFPQTIFHSGIFDSATGARGGRQTQSFRGRLHFLHRGVFGSRVKRMYSDPDFTPAPSSASSRSPNAPPAPERR